MKNIKSLKKIVKTVFFATVSILVVLEILRLKKTVNVMDIRAAVENVSLSHFALMILCGLIAVMPMLFYDFILNRELHTNFSKGYIMRTSWCINTINNLAGFGGLVDIGLRYSFYAQEEEEKVAIQTIGKIILYFMIGFSIYGWIALGLDALFPVAEVNKYHLVLIGVALYMPIILLAEKFKKVKSFGAIQRKSMIELIFVSFCDWSLVILCFSVTGRLMGINVPIVNIIPLYTMAIALGIVSMIPGGIGSFDLIMIAGLESLGIDNAKVIAWLLLFRLVYYIIPFCIGIIFFFYHMGEKMSGRVRSVFRSVGESISHFVELFIVRVFGVGFVLTALIPDKIDRIPFFGRYGHINGQLLWQFPTVLLGICFILLARGIKSRVKRSFPLGIVLLILTGIYINIDEWNIHLTIVIIAMILLMLAIRPQLDVKQFLYSREAMVIDGCIITGTMLLLFIFGQYSWISHLVHKNHRHPFVRYMQMGMHALVLVAIVALIYYALVRYLQGKKRWPGEELEPERLEKFLATYRGNPDSGLAFLGDKRIFWYQKEGVDEVALQFGCENNKCVVMGEPFGNRVYFKEAIEAMILSAGELGYDVVFYEVGQEITLFLHECGFSFLKFGESAVVNIADFSLEGKSRKKFRLVNNRLEKQGYHFDIVKAPHSEELLDCLEEISTHWLEGRPEKGFSLGFFSRPYLQRGDIALIRDENEKVVAFANIMPDFSDEMATIDLMRHDPETAPAGTMDYLFVSLFLHFKEMGKELFFMGMAPLSNVGNLKNSFLQERIAYLIYTYSQHFYSFSGLREYKEKFDPDWSARYVCYPKHSWLICDMLSVFMIDNRVIEL